MKEIKFRAFIKEFSQMTNVEYLHIATEEVEVCLSHGGFGTKIFSYSDGLTGAVLMQYTGLKDKNGVEIYESDVVKGHYWMNGKPHRIIGKIEYVGSGFMLSGINQYRGLREELNPTFEVIGNLYENPNLLEGESNESQ